MKRILILLMLLSVGTASAGDIFSKDQMSMQLTVSSALETETTASDYFLQSLTAELSFYPTDSTTQKVTGLDTQPKAVSRGDNLVYSWESVGRKEFSLSANVDTQFYQPQIKRKVIFPIKDLRDELRKFTKPAEKIDSDHPAIIELSQQLAEGEDDLYILENRIAAWIQDNINYSLETLTAEVAQKSSWAVENRYGVCDEITSVFIALNRALGIPARYISGVAYTNFEDKNDWGPHAWAEVYFPDFGWVPYDITYGEIGYLDSTHIRLQETLDAGATSTRYEWRGRNIDVKTYPLDIQVTQTGTGEDVASPLSLSTSILKPKIGYGSYNMIEVQVRNLVDYYVSTAVSLSRTPEIRLLEKPTKIVALRPYEKKYLFWPIRITSDLKPGFMYTFPVMAISSRNETSLSDFEAVEVGPVYPLKELEDIVQQKREKQRVGISRLSVNCTPEKEEYYEYEPQKIICKAQNIGTAKLVNATVCIEEGCKRFDLPIAKEQYISFPVKKVGVGRHGVKVTTQEEIFYADLVIADDPEVAVRNITNPSSVRYNEEYTVVMDLEKISQSNPFNVSILFDGIENTWGFEEMEQDNELTFHFTSIDLRPGRNDFNVTVIYHDRNGKRYTAHGEFTIDFTDLTFGQKVKLFFRRLFTR